ncbi:hypothetical protein ACQCSU_16615 [Pseudarthrobacter sp. O4]|uniref:hypothetical protein n=1 Tax=Pseudarthrobacter sp. O4 TaxID=3418417 RepID=UPI003CE93AD3
MGDYLAISDTSREYFEIMVRSRAGTRELLDLPGVTFKNKDNPDSGANSEVDEVAIDESIDYSAQQSLDLRDEWKLSISDPKQGWQAELSPQSDEFSALVHDPMASPILGTGRGRPSVTLKLWGIKAANHDQAVHVLEKHAGSLLFEFDVRYGLLLELTRSSVGRSRGGISRNVNRTQPPTLPRSEYSSEALSLYNYARAAVGLPLLQFLAYYQVLEFFFPQYSRQSALKRIRQELVDPRFDFSNEADLAKILTIGAAVGGPYAKEVDQLRATVDGITSEASLCEFMAETAGLSEAMADKKLIKDVSTINFENRGQSVVDQCSARIYSLRCRIVHTKSDGQGTGGLLLPGSKEAHSLNFDVHLLQYLAQKAIIAGATKL